MKLPHRLPSPAMVVACVALSVALGGTSYAAIRVSGKNVRDGSLTGRDIKNNSVASADVKNGGLLSKDFKAGQLPAGPTGPAGPQGPGGGTGPPGASGATKVVVRKGANVTVPNEGPDAGSVVRDAFVSCLAGERATGGGIQSAQGDINPAGAYSTYALVSRTSQESGTPTGWFARAVNRSGTTAGGGSPSVLNAYVICSSP